MPVKRREMGGPSEQAFGRLVRQLRTARGMSQERLAEASGCDRSYLSFVERGISSPTLSTVFLIAEALGVKPSVLLARVEDELAAEGGPAEVKPDAPSP